MAKAKCTKCGKEVSCACSLTKGLCSKCVKEESE